MNAPGRDLDHLLRVLAGRRALAPIGERPENAWVGSSQGCHRISLQGMVFRRRVLGAWGPALGQVWMDHICLRPAAASGFRLTLKDGAEPSLGAPGPE